MLTRLNPVNEVRALEESMSDSEKAALVLIPLMKSGRWKFLRKHHVRILFVLIPLMKSGR